MANLFSISLTLLVASARLLHIDKYPKDVFVFANIDGSSDETFSNGGSGVFMTTPSDATYRRVISAGITASCFTYELQVIIEALETLPILELVKETNAVANFKLRDKSISLKHQLRNIRGDSLMTKTTNRPRIGHYRGMKTDRDGRRTYRNWDNNPNTELTPDHIFHCPTVPAALKETEKKKKSFSPQTSKRIIMDRLKEQSSGPMVLSNLV
ncbi:hypothetical protein TNCV_3403881 [Trichonephila clavipes]|nr:hypothetical protein TNCV_3403881 [Trichonephila clavipes]